MGLAGILPAFHAGDVVVTDADRMPAIPTAGTAVPRPLGDCIAGTQPFFCPTLPMQPPFRTDEKTLARRELQIERKQLTIEIRENFRGRFLRITEKCGGKTNVVIVPDTGINEFNAALDGVISEATGLQP